MVDGVWWLWLMMVGSSGWGVWWGWLWLMVFGDYGWWCLVTMVDDDWLQRLMCLVTMVDGVWWLWMMVFGDCGWWWLARMVDGVWWLWSMMVGNDGWWLFLWGRRCCVAGGAPSPCWPPPWNRWTRSSCTRGAGSNKQYANIEEEKTILYVVFTESYQLSIRVIFVVCRHHCLFLWILARLVSF